MMMMMMMMMMMKMKMKMMMGKLVDENDSSMVWFVVWIVEEYPVLQCFFAQYLRFTSFHSKWSVQYTEMGQAATPMVRDSYSSCCKHFFCKIDAKMSTSEDPLPTSVKIVSAARFGSIPNSPSYRGCRQEKKWVSQGLWPNSFLVDLCRSFDSPSEKRYVSWSQELVRDSFSIFSFSNGFPWPKLIYIPQIQCTGFTTISWYVPVTAPNMVIFHRNVSNYRGG